MADIFADRSAAPMFPGGDAEPFDRDDFLFEPLFGGERCLAYVGDGDVVLHDKDGFDLTAVFRDVADSLRDGADDSRSVLDGEIIVAPTGVPDPELLSRRLRNKTIFGHDGRAAIVVSDILYRDREAVTGRGAAERRSLLEAAVRQNDGVVVAVSVNGSGKRFVDSVRARGLPGVRAKRLDSQYRMGKRSNDWLTMSSRPSELFLICGYLPKANNMVSLILGRRADDGAILYEGHVTLGDIRADMATIAANRKAKKHPFAEPPPASNDSAVWLVPTLECRVGYAVPPRRGKYQRVYRGLTKAV
ncbi:MAG: hypothetical protein LUG50_14745 [Planctomycetaceae bacterium]|nr:hypothetical protein [Planctomycetaceae bacterium]